MKKNSGIIVFFIALIANIAGILLGDQTLQFASKPLILTGLIIHFILAVRKEAFHTWIIPALFFSLAGDVLLLFQQKDSLFFLLGLSAFLVAHLCYILFFHRTRLREGIAGRWWPLLIVVMYYGALMILLGHLPAAMKLPVRVYGVVISFMFMLAMHMLFLADKKTGRLFFVGALLFVISDSVLAIDKFYQAFEWAGVLIMLTYGYAQLLLTEGAIRYMTMARKE